MRSLLFAIGLAASLPAQSTPAHTDLPSRAELDSITARGTALYQYDRAAWDASDAIMKIDPDPRIAQMYVVGKAGTEWIVFFGKLTPARDTFFIAYSADKTARDSVFTAAKIPFSDPDTRDQLHAARAILTARAAFGKVTRPYNSSVIPAGHGEWWVYLYPAQTVTTSWPLGGDERFRISEDGYQILERHRMHVIVLETPVGPSHVEAPAGYVPLGLQHSAILDNRPEDTDVFAVLSRATRVPEYVSIDGGWSFKIDVDGKISMPEKHFKP
jgi:hypothetical protein